VLRGKHWKTYRTIRRTKGGPRRETLGREGQSLAEHPHRHEKRQSGADHELNGNQGDPETKGIRKEGVREVSEKTCSKSVYGRSISAPEETSPAARDKAGEEELLGKERMFWGGTTAAVAAEERSERARKSSSSEHICSANSNAR